MTSNFVWIMRLKVCLNIVYTGEAGRLATTNELMLRQSLS